MSEGLNSAAYDLCERIRGGAFDEEIKRTANGQPAACPEVISELRRLYPGHETKVYQAAIARGMRDSR